MFIFLTACRNEERTIREFWAEFVGMAGTAGLLGRSVLYIVDDFSTDGTMALLEEMQTESSGVDLRIIRAPTNLGNQGAMFHGLRRVDIEAQDMLITFDSDGEDDVNQMPSILEMGRRNPGKAVLIERGRRRESLLFKLFFATYKLIFRYFTRQTVVPNNFMLLPGALVPVVQRSPLAAVHLAYAILKLRPPYVATVCDRRSRYGGTSSQNIFMLVSHGLVGLMLFFEVVVAKIFVLLFAFGLFTASIIVLAVAIPAEEVVAHNLLLSTAIAAAAGAIGLIGLLLSAALALMFKLMSFMLAEFAVDRQEGLTRQLEGAASARHDARRERVDRGAG